MNYLKLQDNAVSFFRASSLLLWAARDSWPALCFLLSSPPMLPFYPFFASSTLNCSYSSCPYVQKATRRLVVNSFTEREKLLRSRRCHFSSWIFNFTELHSSQQFELWIDGPDSHAWFHLSLSLSVSMCIHTYIYISMFIVCHAMRLYCISNYNF